MLIFVIAVVVIVVIVVVALMMAQGSAFIDKAVQENEAAIQNNQEAGKANMKNKKQSNKYDPALTMGYEIPIDADIAQQLRAARVLAAKQAAKQPRGANMGVGRLGDADDLKTAWDGVAKDPVTAVKIAAYHGWDGLKTGAVAAVPVAAPAAPKAAPAPTAELVPGKDYPVIEITDDMSPADKRKARIANSKAKSAAKKAAKEAGASAVPVAEAAAPAAAATAVAVPEPTLIEITDDMAPDDKRKARIANSKAKSAYKKALKAAGVDPKAAAASAPAAPVAEPAVAAIPEPTLIEITDDMSPEDKRAARIANSKAKSAYKKALKAAGG